MNSEFQHHPLDRNWLKCTPKEWIRQGIIDTVSWIPVTSFDGDFFGIDLSPAAKGTKGQVIYLNEELNDLRIVAMDYCSWFAIVAEELSAVDSQEPIPNFMPERLTKPDSKHARHRVSMHIRVPNRARCSPLAMRYEYAT